MTWNEIKSKLVKFKDRKISNEFRNYIYQRHNKLVVSDSAIRSWYSGRAHPSAEYAILLKEFFEKNKIE